MVKINRGKCKRIKEIDEHVKERKLKEKRRGKAPSVVSRSLEKGPKYGGLDWKLMVWRPLGYFIGFSFMG